ncbi:MAG: DUF2341 domain-containing protein [Candidatus Methanoperedens sp.]|nr:DUF2341 domain-containing protein [Candidatus Methanoperedens sp.]
MATLLVAVVFVPSIGANPDANQKKSEKALEFISQKHAIPKEQLMIVNEKEANFPLSNQKIWSVKILDTKTTEAYGADLDAADNIADIKEAKALEVAKYVEKYGKKEIELHEKLQKMNPDDTVEVGIWLSPIINAPKPEREISEQEYKEILDAKKKAYAQKEKPVLDILKAKNINIRYTSQYAPLIYAEVPAKLMAEVENIPEVDGIYLAREFKPLLDKVVQTVKVQPVWNAGITGSGIKVAVVEEGAINFSNTYLISGTNNMSALPSNHATEVAGIIASQHPTYKGISYGVPGLLSANFGPWDNSDPAMESRIIRASEWAVNNGANILSNSWGNNTDGTMSGIDKYFDHVVWEDGKTVTVAAGNNESGENGNVTSPGLGYNVITVGGFEDKDTSAWSDDTMWGMGQSPGSAWRDPVSQHGDRDKPEVAAMATHISESNKIITTRSPTLHDPSPIDQTVAAGTSYAAPSVAGEAALLMQAKSWLTAWPETVKAIIMASANHNIEGDSTLSEYDGAGGIDISRAYEIAYNDNMSGDVLFASDFPKNYTFTVTSVNQKIRVAIAWDSHPDSNHPPTSDTLESDLDLYILDPNGNIVASSTSYDNSYEIVEFTPQTTGTFKARVSANRFDGAYEYVGFAKTLPYLSGWDHRKLKTITGTTAGAQTNYQMKLTVYKGSGTDSPGVVYLGGNVRDDFGDLRFTKSDGVTLLDYWIESYTSGVSAVVWVEVDSIPASPDTANIYLHYGNPSATSTSDGTATFNFFDHFDGSSLDSGKWVINLPSEISTSQSGGILTITGTGSWGSTEAQVYSTADVSKSYTSMVIRWNPGNSIYGLVGGSGWDANGLNGYWLYTSAWIRKDSTFYTGQGTSSTYSGDTIPTPPSAYQITEIQRNSPTNTKYLSNGSLIDTKTTYVPNQDMRLAFSPYQPGKTIYVDWAAVRKFVSPEPAWA